MMSNMKSLSCIIMTAGFLTMVQQNQVRDCQTNLMLQTTSSLSLSKKPFMIVITQVRMNILFFCASSYKN